MLLYRCSKSDEAETTHLGGPPGNQSIDICLILLFTSQGRSHKLGFTVWSRVVPGWGRGWYGQNEWTFLVFFSAVVLGFELAWSTMASWFVEFLKGFLACMLLLSWCVSEGMMSGASCLPSCWRYLNTKYSFMAFPKIVMQHYCSGNTASFIIDAFQETFHKYQKDCLQRLSTYYL